MATESQLTISPPNCCARVRARVDLPEAVGPRTTTSSGSAFALELMGGAAGSPCAPRNALAKPQECQSENEDGDQQHSENLEALTREQALLELELAVIRPDWFARVLRIIHKRILRAAPKVFRAFCDHSALRKGSSRPACQLRRHVHAQEAREHFVGE